MGFGAAWSLSLKSMTFQIKVLYLNYLYQHAVMLICSHLICNYGFFFHCLYCHSRFTNQQSRSDTKIDFYSNMSIIWDPYYGQQSYWNRYSYYLLNDKFIWLAIRFRAKTLGTSFWFLIWSIFALGKSYLFISFSPETLPLAFEFTNSVVQLGLQRWQPYLGVIQEDYFIILHTFLSISVLDGICVISGSTKTTPFWITRFASGVLTCVKESWF